MPRYSSLEARYSERSPILGGEDTGCLQVIPKRYTLTLVSFLGLVHAYALRVNLSVAMVAMVLIPVRPDLSGSGDSSIACLELLKDYKDGNDSMHDLPSRGEFDWDSQLQARALGSFFYGYVITQIPGGILAEKYGGKWLFGIGILITSVCTLLTPLAARMDIWALIVVRIIEGLGEGVTYPAINVLIGKWVPEVERSRLATIIYNGSAFGTVIALSVSGILSDTNFLGGWPSVFYVFGTTGCLWFLLWAIVVHESPDTHPTITKEELLYIKRGQKDRPRNVKIPWKSILTSFPVWALIVTHFSQNWGFYTLLTELPNYLSNILHFNLKKNGVLSAFPYLVSACFSILASFLADKLRSLGNLRNTTVRKIFNSIAFFLPGLLVGLVPFVGCSPVTIMLLLSLSMGFNGFIHSGFNVTHVDMSPMFAGFLMGITNCIANLSGFLAPAYVGWAIEDGQTLGNWSTVFFTTSAIFFVGGFVYNYFGTAELQPWGSSLPSQKRSSDQDIATTALVDDPS